MPEVATLMHQIRNANIHRYSGSIMLHDSMFYLHLLGMIVIVGSALLLLTAKLAEKGKNAAALALAGATHTQFLTGLILFLMGLATINAAKYGVKLLLVVVLIVLSTMFRKRLGAGKPPAPMLIPSIVLVSLVITGIAFFWH